MSRKKSTRQLIGIDDIKNDSVVTADGELAFYFVHPSNLNVLPEQGVRAKVQELLGVLKGMAELELLALDSKESFQDNRQFYRQRLEAKMQEVLQSTTIDESRILTEAAIFADKVAVDEETVRLRSHIAQLRDMLQSSEPVGRKLDFLIQEVNRECNTIGSKCNDLTVARDVVNMKAEVEKIREQVQNME